MLSEKGFPQASREAEQGHGHRAGIEHGKGSSHGPLGHDKSGHDKLGHGQQRQGRPGHGRPGHGHGPFGQAPAVPLRMEDLFASEQGEPLAHAFSKKATIHPFMNARPIAREAMAASWERIKEIPRKGKSVAYLHIPFCENHCLYCGFYQNPWRTNQSSVYADAIICELQAHRDSASHSGAPIHAVYFGGGTPTALETKDLCRIIEAVHECLPLAPDCEITIEGRIFSFPLEKAKACFAAGANRMSLGVQTFDTRLRRRMGRKVSGEEAQAFLSDLLDLDQGAIIIDLIFGFPSQTEEGWAEDVAKAAALGLDGVDLYALNLLPSSPLAMSIEKGKMPPAPDQSAMGRFYQIGSEVLSRHGWQSISTSHWRRATRERNLYNLLVKSGASCLAFGAGAGGNLANISFRLNGDLQGYMESVARGDKPLGFMMQTPERFNFLNETKAQMEVGLLHVEALCERLGALRLDTAADILPLLKQWQRAGLLELADGWGRLTIAGRFWQVTMTQYLIQWVQQRLEAAAAQ